MISIGGTINPIEELVNVLQVTYDARANKILLFVKREETDSRFDDVFQIAVTMIATLKSTGNQSYEDIINGLMKSEPFCKYPKIRVKLIENFKS